MIYPSRTLLSTIVKWISIYVDSEKAKKVTKKTLMNEGIGRGGEGRGREGV